MKRNFSMTSAVLLVEIGPRVAARRFAALNSEQANRAVQPLRCAWSVEWL